MEGSKQNHGGSDREGEGEGGRDRGDEEQGRGQGEEQGQVSDQEKEQGQGFNATVELDFKVDFYTRGWTPDLGIAFGRILDLHGL